MALLEIESLNRHFGGLHAVANLDLEVVEGSIKGIIGPNGAGKTTTFNLIAGNLPASSGNIRFEERELRNLKPYEVAERGILRTFQTIRLCGQMTVRDNVMLGRHVRSRAGFAAAIFRPKWMRTEEREIRNRSDEILEQLGVIEHADKEATNLPFGTQRAVELARALAAEPKLLLLDEPASGLNTHETSNLASLIGEIRNLGVTVLLVVHDMSLVMDVCDSVAVLDFGRKIADGTPKEIQKNDEVIKVYLGEEDA